MSNEQNSEVFEVAIAMSGAISAGAYTAGVLDYLMRAIDAHNAWYADGTEKDGQPAPTYKIVVNSISGASAGGICAGLSVANLINLVEDSGPRNRIKPAQRYQLNKDRDGVKLDYYLAFDRLHQAWVDNVTLWNGSTGLLGTRDLDTTFTLIGSETPTEADTGAVLAMLDCTHLDDVAVAALTDIHRKTGATFDFISKDLDVFLTTAALTGVPYEVSFAGAHSSHPMRQHSINRHFRLTGLGDGDSTRAWLDQWKDGGILLDLTNPQTPVELPFLEKSSVWYNLTVAALATSAFPVGLAPRQIRATANQLGVADETGAIAGGAMPVQLPGAPPAPVFPDIIAFDGDRPIRKPVTAEDDRYFVAVDGGAINNDPFGIGRFSLKDQAQLSPTEPDQLGAGKAVVMISPFPSEPEFSTLNGKKLFEQATLLSSAMKLLPTLLNQSRFKMNELVAGFNPKIHTRFMISPVRTKEGQPRRSGGDAIACGSLGGFGGFLDRAFRSHDFVLGQRNCQHFIKNHFVQGNTPVISPLPGFDPHMEAEVPLPQWPNIGKEELKPQFVQLRKRFNAVMPRLIDEMSSGVVGWIARRAWHGVPDWAAWGNWSGRAAMNNGAVAAIISNLTVRGQFGLDGKTANDLPLVSLIAKHLSESTGITFADLAEKIYADTDIKLLEELVTDDRIQAALDSMVEIGAVTRNDPRWWSFGNQTTYSWNVFA